MESRDLQFDMSPAEQRLARARVIANDPRAPFEEWRAAYLLVQNHDIWKGVSSCATSTEPSADLADGRPSE